ncbi:MAG: hypothetical protein U0U69_04290 [Acidimicrobiia bacterium]
MRVHITLDEGLVERLDARVGVRQRSRFISEAVKRAVEDEERWEAIEAAIATVPEAGHDWDEDPAAWVRAQRRGDVRRVG